MSGAALRQHDIDCDPIGSPLRLRCLVIEDNAFDQKRMERLLRETGINQESAYCGTVADAEAILFSVKFDLLMIDYRLPDGNAIALLNDLRRSGQKNAETPAILFSGEDSEDLRVPGRSAGFSSVMTKYHLTAQRVALAITLAMAATA